MTAETASSVDAAPAASSRLRPLIMAAAAAMLVIGAVAVFAIAVEPAPEEPLTATPMTIAPDTPRQMTSTVSPLDSATADPASLSVDDPVANAVRVVDVPDVGTDDQFSQIDPLLNPTPVMGDALTGAGTPDADLMASMADTLGPLVLREAAASGDAKAQFEIGERLMSNRFGEADPAAAKAWFERAAAQDLAPAQYRLASLHEKGTGTAQDPVLARTWYERAAGQGNARAMHNLGVLYAEGAFGEADFVNAVTWFEQGARHGVPDSQFNLGIIYGRGLGVAQDLAGAYMWFDVAGRKGDQDAIAKRDEVAAVMTPEQLADGKARSADLVLTTPTEAANAVTLPSEMIGDVAALQTPAEQAPAALPAAPREVVRQVQQLLALRGYDPGPADGLTGQRTANAVAGFQNDAGLPVTGVITPDLVSALIAS